MGIEKRKLWVFLGSSENPSSIAQASRNVKLEEANKNIEAVFYEVADLKEASEVCQKYIRYFNLGSGNFSGGRVIDDNDNFVARISYNGRVWDSNEFGKAKEIEI